MNGLIRIGRPGAKRINRPSRKTKDFGDRTDPMLGFTSLLNFSNPAGKPADP
jgi:hypothetical protein